MSQEPGFLHDERGSRSSARVLLIGALLFAGALIVLDSLAWNVPGLAYVLMGTVCTGLLAWAAGPRIAQYVGPQLGGVAAAVATAARNAGTDDRYKDDER